MLGWNLRTHFLRQRFDRDFETLSEFGDGIELQAGSQIALNEGERRFRQATPLR